MKKKSDRDYIIWFLDREFDVKHRKLIARDDRTSNNFRAIVAYLEQVFGFRYYDIQEAVKFWAKMNGIKDPFKEFNDRYSSTSTLSQLLEPFCDRELTDDEINEIHAQLNQTSEYVNRVINQMTNVGHELMHGR